MTNQPHFDVFLAHNSVDKPEVRTIATKLKRRGLKVWLDEEQIPPGRPFQDVIQQAIQNVKSAAIFVGTAGLGRWQILELRSLLSQFVDADIPVIPVLLPGVERIPRDFSFLQDLNWVSFTNGIDDENALNQLEWGITQHPIVLPPPSGQFDVLLFYNDEDSQEVQPIINWLREQQIQLWLTQEVRGGDAWQQVLETQLAQINSVAVFIGRSGSLWRREQIEPFIWEFVEQGRFVIPVILSNVLQEPELPIYLRRRTRVDFRQQDPNPMEQLIQGITGKPPKPELPRVFPPQQVSKFRLLMVPLIGMTIGIIGTLIALKYIFSPPTNLVTPNTNPEKQDGVQAYDALTYHCRGYAYYKQGNYTEAIADYNQALQLKPDFAEAYYNRGNAYGKQGNYTEAIADYNQALKLKPNYTAAYHSRGYAYYKQGNYKRAIADYNQTLQLKPDFAEAYYNKAGVYSSEREVKEAIKNLQRAIDLDARLRENAKIDSAFDNIRQDKQFQALVGQ